MVDNTFIILIILDVAEKIRVEKNMNTLTLSGNTVGIEAAKAIGNFLLNNFL